jgi:hypothetical protein
MFFFLHGVLDGCTGRGLGIRLNRRHRLPCPSRSPSRHWRERQEEHH